MKTKNQIHKIYLRRREAASQVQYEYLTETHYIRPSHKAYPRLVKAAHAANNLYNSGLYILRQSLIHEGKFLNYNAIDKILKQQRNQKQNMVYDQPGHASTSQQILMIVGQNWNSWLKALKAYRKDPKKFTGRPKMPCYLKKGKMHSFNVSNGSAKLKDGFVIINSLDKLKIKMKHQTDKIQQVRVIPAFNFFKIEIVYKTNIQINYKEDNGRYLTIDPGLANAFTLASNVPGVKPVVLNGRPIKALNQFFNKTRAKLTSKAKTELNLYSTKRLIRLSKHRALKLDKFAHEASKYIVDYALSHELNTIVIGYTKDFKRSSNMGKKNNQNFIGISHKQMIDKIIYKANLAGLVVLTTEESYTSQTSFLDGEQPCWNNGNKSRAKQGISPATRRFKRGLYKSNKGILINADVNGALQILKKVVPNVYADGIEGVGLHPAKINLAF